MAKDDFLPPPVDKFHHGWKIAKDGPPASTNWIGGGQNWKICPRAQWLVKGGPGPSPSINYNWYRTLQPVSLLKKNSIGHITPDLQQLHSRRIKYHNVYVKNLLLTLKAINTFCSLSISRAPPYQDPHPFCQTMGVATIYLRGDTSPPPPLNKSSLDPPHIFHEYTPLF